MRSKCNRMRILKTVIVMTLCGATVWSGFQILQHPLASISGNRWDSKLPKGTVYNATADADFSDVPGMRNVRSGIATVSGRAESMSPELAVTVTSTATDDVHNQSTVTTQLSDILITVKTTGKYHATRLDLQLKTWWSLASSHSYIFTDIDDDTVKKRSGYHVINTKCPSQHTREALCCKMSSEFDFFIQSNKRWWCHVDDDTYINVLTLLGLLRQYRHQEDWYIGRTSVVEPITVKLPDSITRVPFEFATGGAGFCVSRGLGLKMVPYALGGKFVSECQKVHLPDDCTIGVIIHHYMKRPVTVSQLFWSHLHFLPSIKQSELQQQVTFSYNLEQPGNVVNVDGFNATHDPTRFLSIHCFLFPSFADYCPQKSRQ